jgi:hypothetical protein
MMMMKSSLGALAALALFLSACATAPAPGPSTEGGASIASGELDLGGEWRRASVGDVSQRFERGLSARYAAGLELAQASGDLRDNDFRCHAGREGAGEAPAQVCSRTETVGDCTHTWQAHLFEGENHKLSRTRALYDRRCGGDGLLGGPD